MTLLPSHLYELIRTADEIQPITDALCREHGTRLDEKQHMCGWLSEYQSPGFYNRSNTEGTARQAYQRFQDPYGLLWLAEALGVEQKYLISGAEAIRNTYGQRGGTMSAALRRAVPWEVIETRAGIIIG